MKSVAAILFVLVNAGGVYSFADLGSQNNGTYSFGGSCKSQGSWTKDALAGTQSLIVVAEQLKNDPNCNVLAKSLDMHLSSLKNSVNAINADEPAANRLSSLKEETLGLRKFVSASGQMQSNVIDLILNNTVDAAITATDITGATAMASSILNTGQRISRATNAGLDILEKVMDAALQENKCLATPNTAGPFLASMIEVTSAFAGSGQDSFGRKMSGLVNKISQLMRDGKYVNVMKQLNKTQLRNSISCLMEVASSSYCSTLEAEALFNEQMGRLAVTSGKDNRLVRDDRNKTNVKKGPLEGFYILSQQIPKITQWVERVQRGVEPRSKADGAFNNSVLSTTQNFYATENELLANFNTARASLRQIDDLAGKKNQILKILMQLSGRLENNIIADVDNFYTITLQPRAIPFALIGRPVPREVVEAMNGVGLVAPNDWFIGQMPNLNEFNDPEQLMATIDKNLRDLINQSRKKADSFYRQWIIYDHAALVVDSITGLSFNVRDSLVAVQRYLDHLEEKIRNTNSSDGSALSMISETQIEIQAVLEKYEELYKLGEEFKKLAPNDIDGKKALVQRGRKVNQELIDTVFERFNMQKGKSMFLANRVAILVKKDFETMVNSDKNFTPEAVRNILYATGEAAFERMVQMSSASPKDIKFDIKNAQQTNKDNLQAIEMLFRDHFVATIAYMKMVAENRTPNDDDIRKDSWKRAKKDYWEEMPLATRHVGAVFEGIVKWADLYFSYYKGNSDKYPRSMNTPFGNNKQGSYFDTETRSAQQLYEFYCIQSLAFKDWRPFRDLCKSVVLRSPYVANNLTPQAQKFFNETLNVSYEAKLSAGLSNDTNARIKQAENLLKYAKDFNAMTPQQRQEHQALAEQLSRNQTARICAYHNYSTNNEVMHLTLGKDKD